MNAYERYEQRIRRLARLLSILKKNSPFIAAGLLLIACAVIALLAVTGNVTAEVVCDDVVYGEELSYRAGVLWTEASFEFSRVGSDERSTEAPTMPGSYVIHAYGENVFGQRKYSEREFTIKKRELVFRLSGASVTYGEEIDIDEVLTYSGQLSTDTVGGLALTYDRCLAGNSPLGIDVDAITVTSADGRDVKEAYDIRVATAFVTVKKRVLVISTQSLMKIYDSTPLESDGLWKLEEGSLVSGDVADIRVGGSLTEVGEVPNSVIYAYITRADGRNVSDCYEIDAREGIIKVVKGRITLRVNDLTTTYTGSNLTPTGVTVEKGELYDGDSIGSVVYSGGGTDVGTYSCGIRSLAITNNGRDVTDDYIIDVVEGTLNVTPIELTLRTLTESKVYDGAEILNSYELIRGVLAAGHRIECDFPEKYIEVGAYANSVEARVLDESGADVTKNYKIGCEQGTITITERYISLAFSDTYAKYNGKTPSHGYFSRLEGSVAVGDSIKTAPKNDMIDVGNYVNELIVTIVNREGKDVTHCYKIDAEFGTLLIQKADVVFTTTSVSYTYNGKYITPNAYSQFPSLTAPGHDWANVEFTVSEMVPGNYTSTVEKKVRILNEDGRDVTHNFNITYSFGDFTINHRTLNITTPSFSKVYDGTPLTYDGEVEYDKQGDDEEKTGIIYSGLIKGHTITGTLGNNSITDVRSVRMSYTDIMILDENGEDVKKYYSIYTANMGTLSVTKRRITVTTASASKIYDGTPLTDKSFTVTENSIVDGEELVFEVTGTITEPGSAPNSMTEIRIVKADGSDGTANYGIYTSPGTLTVIDPNATETGNGGTGNGTGTNGGEGEGKEPGFELDPNGGLGIGESMPGTEVGDAIERSAFSVYSTEGHIAYLKYMSFGDYSYNKWKQAPEYGSTLDNRLGYQYLAGIALEKANMRKINMKLKLNVGNYLLPYYLGTDESDYVPQKSDAVNRGSGDGEISVYYYYYDVETSGIPKVSLGEYANREEIYRRFVYDRYLYLPSSTMNYYKTILDENDFGETTEEKIKSILEYVRSHAVYDLEYDRSLDKTSDVAVSFLRDYGEGVCQHFATAGTALFRAAGIPARYTIGWVTRTEAGKWVKQKGAAHAWVEIYIDGIGWMHVDPTPTSAINIEDILNGWTAPSESETLPKEPGNVTEPADDAVLQFRTGYTGPMFLREFNYSLFEKGRWTSEDSLNEYEKLQLLLASHALERMGATEYKLRIDYLRTPVRLLLPYYVTSGAAELKPKGDIYYPYNGKVSTTLGFIPGIRCDTSFVGASLDGEYAEIEEMYRILVRKTYLKIDNADRIMLITNFPRLPDEETSTAKVNYVLSLVREMRKKAIDGEISDMESLDACISSGMLTSDEYATTLAVLMLRVLGVPSRYVEGYLVSSVSSQLTVVRDSDRTCWAEIYVDGIGWIPVSIREDIPNPFAIDDDVTTQTITVRANSAEKLFDGAALTADGFKIVGGWLLNGHRAVATVEGSQQYVGTSRNSIVQLNVYDGDGNDVTSLYNVFTSHGELTVYPLVGNPLEGMRGTVGKNVMLGGYRWWSGTENGEPVFTLTEGDKEGVQLTKDGILTVKRAGIYRISVSADGVDLNGDETLELLPIEPYEFTLTVNEFSNVMQMDMMLDEAVARNIQARPDAPQSFTEYGTYIGLVAEMGSATKLYDGHPLTCDEAEIVDGRLRSGDKLYVKGSGSAVFCGATKNGCAELTIRDSEGRDVTHLYSVTVYPGMLTVRTALPTLENNTVSIGLGETLSIDELFRSDYISNYPMSITLSRENGVVSLKGETVRGMRLGESMLRVTLLGCDLNGDGFNEYSQTVFSVRIKTGIAAWQIVLTVLFCAALIGYILIYRHEKGMTKRKKGTD